jgi:hypothetical protein
MKKFLFKIFSIGLSFVLLKMFLFFLMTNILEKSYNSKKVLVIGDSHIERGWKPFNNEINFAKSAQSLLYSVAKLRRFKLLPGRSFLVIGISNVTLNQKALLGIDYFLERSFCYLKLREHFYLIRFFPFKWLKALILLNATVFKDPYNNTGFSPMAENSNLKSATNNLRIISENDVKNDIGLLALRQFISENTNVNIFLVRMPMYSTKIALINDDLFQAYIRRLTNDFNNVKYLDFHKSSLFKSSKIFYDWDHLNSKGADCLFSHRLKNNIKFN